MSRENFDELSDSLDLEYWCDREGVRFRLSRGQSGMQLNIQECPACNDRRWRTYLNKETGVGNCFVCNATFSKLSFIHRHLGFDPADDSPGAKKNWSVTFKHVRETLGEQGWRPKRVTPTAVSFGDVKLPLSVPLPTEDGSNLQYLIDRGLTPELTRYFNLRYCEFGTWQFTVEGELKKQFFGGRLIIPVFDLDGTLKTFQGRDITNTRPDKKYLFPIGLPGTGRYLLNGQSAGGVKRLVMNEGFFDVAATKMALDEDPNLRAVMPIGSFGKHLSSGSETGDDQLGRLMELKARGLEELTIMWDGETAALHSALHAAETISRRGIDVRIAFLPKDKDPNEVPASVVRDAFLTAKPYTKSLAVKMFLRSPYS